MQTRSMARREQMSDLLCLLMYMEFLYEPETHYVMQTTESEDECPVCLESMADSECCITECDHVIHSSCAERILKIQGNTCPLCRGQILIRTYIE